MNLFGSPNIEKLAAEHDFDGLYRLLEHRDMLIRLQAAQALADLNDGAGWRFLIDTLRGDADSDTRGVAAAMLGELGHPRAVPALKEVLENLRQSQLSDPLEEVVRLALESIDSLDAEEALREGGYEPVLRGQSHTVIEYEDHYARQVRYDQHELTFRSAEQHLNSAVELREAELTERGLVEDSLALWLSPQWGYAWYLRGVLFEDLDRNFEALLAYQQALELEPTLREAREALAELQEAGTLPADEPDRYYTDLNSRDWAERRDAAAGLADLARRGDPLTAQAALALIDHLEDEDREVRHAALEALGYLRQSSAVQAILAMRESSWLVRFSILQALAWMGSVNGLISALRSEMDRIQERNPIFSSQKDPLLEVEYAALLEIGIRALERTGDIETLLDMAESNAWVEIDEAPEEAVEELDAPDTERIRMGYEEEFGALEADAEEADAEEAEEDDDLSSYVDEVAEMGVIALRRLAEASLPNLSEDILERLRVVPDLTLVDLETADDEDDSNDLAVVQDLSALRAAAEGELRRRQAGSPPGGNNPA